MAMKTDLAAVLAAAVLALACGPAAAQGGADAGLFAEDLLFSVGFDGRAEPDKAKDPARCYPQELYYSYGVSGMAGVPKGRGYCRYPCEGNLDPAQGTLSLWVRPLDWVGAEAGSYVFLSLEGKGKMFLQKLPQSGGDLSLLVRDPDGAEARVDCDVDAWAPGRWRHVVAAWGPKELALYCDGRLAGRSENGVAPPSEVENFYVGWSRWAKVGEAALDEVRIYSRPLSADEAAALHAAQREAFAASRRFPDGVEQLPVRPAAERLLIQVGDSRTFRFKGFDNATQPIGIELRARIHRRGCAQYYGLQMRINGERVSPFVGNSRSFTRLLNKPFFYTYKAGGEGCWYGENWVVYYGLDWDDALGVKTASAEKPEELHRYVFDVTDLLRPDRTNTIEIRNCAYTVRNATHGSDCPLWVEDLAIRRLAPEEDRLVDAYRYPDAGTVVPNPYDKVEYGCTLLPGGGLEVACGGVKYVLESVYSYPGGLGNGFHSDRTLQPAPEWRTTAGADGWSIAGVGRFYRVERTIARRANHIAITDRVVNTGAEDLGMVVKNLVRTGARPEEVYLCGNRNITFAGQLGSDEAGSAAGAAQEYEPAFSSYNPTYFVGLGPGGLGIGAFDDVTRLQSKVFAGPRVGGVFTDRFALAAGKSYDVKWKIFPVAEGGYYDFINTIRVVQGINVFEAESFAVGAWYMGRWEEPKLRKWLDDRNLTHLIVSPMIPGLDMTSRHGPAFVDRADVVVPAYRELVEKVHKVRPSVKVVNYFSTLQFIDEGDYMERAKESLKIRANGKPARYGRRHFCVHVDGKDPFSEELRKYIDFCLDTIGLDGIFWDVMACERERDIDYSRWDGHSALLDKDYRIKRKISIQGIEGIPFFIELIERIYAKDKVLLVDYFSGAETVFETFKKHRVAGMMEGNGLGRSLVRTHLHTPLTMRGAEDPSDPERCFQQVVWNIRNNLRHGNLYGYYGTWVKLKHSISTDYIYPITPVELHPGYIIGRNKIVTIRSGSFGWPKSEAADLKVVVFNDKGEKIPWRSNVLEEGERRLAPVHLAPDHLAVIERVAP